MLYVLPGAHPGFSPPYQALFGRSMKRIKNVPHQILIILYAVSRTLKNHPDLNANMLDDNSIRRFHHVNLGVAVDTPRGLMVPTIHHADEMSLLEISKAVKELAADCPTTRSVRTHRKGVQ